MTGKEEHIEQIKADYAEGELDDVEFEEQLEDAMEGTYNPYQHHTPDLRADDDEPTPMEWVRENTPTIDKAAVKEAVHFCIGLAMIVLMLAEPAFIWVVAFLLVVDYLTD